MKKLALVAISENGILLGNEVFYRTLERVERFTLAKFQPNGWNCQFSTLSEMVRQIFAQYDGIIFIMATGIVVRTIAPYLQGKTVDPAIVVMDEKNKFAISLLSGHLRGANKLAEEIASIMNSCPVITTATDINNLKAIDLLAREWNMFIEPLENIKYFNQALLSGLHYTFWSEKGLEFSPKINPHITLESFKRNMDWNVLITHRTLEYQGQNTIYLRPQNLVLGIGCRKSYSPKALIAIVERFFSSHKLSKKSLMSLATIDIKSKEPALLALQDHLKIPLQTFSKESLNIFVEENINQITTSEFVKKTVGTANVCEAAALLAVKQGELLIKKTKETGVTLAVAIRTPLQVSNSNQWF